MRSTRDRLHRLADAGQHDRQRVHHEAGVDAGAEDGDLALLRQLVDLAREAAAGPVGYASSSVVETIGTRRFTMAATCGTSLRDRRAGAEDGDVRLGRPDHRVDVVGHLQAQLAAEFGDVAEIAPDLARIDIDRPDGVSPLRPAT